MSLESDLWIIPVCGELWRQCFVPLCVTTSCVASAHAVTCIQTMTQLCVVTGWAFIGTLINKKNFPVPCLIQARVRWALLFYVHLCLRAEEFKGTLSFYQSMYQIILGNFKEGCSPDFDQETLDMPALDNTWCQLKNSTVDRCDSIVSPLEGNR